MDSERRKSARQKSFLQGRLYFNHGRSAIDCLVRDISHDGAKLIFSQTAAIPDVVDLYIPQKEQTLQAHVQWRSGDEVGVTFPSTQASASTSGTSDLEERVEHLETEVAALKRMVRRLRADASGNDPEAA